MHKEMYDVAIIGGGINGVGIARDLAGRKLSVVLIEKDDLAAHTSSASSKLIHGGLRYLEHLEFNLVRKALIEREILLQTAPHIAHPLRFVMPHHPSMRPKWLIKAGIFLYDHLAHRDILPDSQTINLQTHPTGAALLQEFDTGYMYSDGWIDDARLVALCALDARENHANILTYTKLTHAKQATDHWELSVQSTLTTNTTNTTQIQAKCLVNAAGPWVSQIFDECLEQKSPHAIRWVKGSHIVVPRIYRGDHAYILQNDDQRIVFVMPYEKNFTLIGTTDVDYHSSLDHVQIEQSEIDYLCKSVTQYLNTALTPSDVVHHFSGVRPLIDDGASNASEATRDYQIHTNQETPSLVSIFGGKLTTFRVLAQEVASIVCDLLRHRSPSWTAQVALPGGAIPNGDFERFLVRATRRYPWLDSELIERWAKAYGTRLYRMLHGIENQHDLGEPIVKHVYACEMHYLINQEFAKMPEDILWRRTKLGLHLNEEEQKILLQWLAQNTNIHFNKKES